MAVKSRANAAPRVARAHALAPRRDVGVVLQGVRRLDRGLRLAARKVERQTGLSAAQLFVLDQLSVQHPLSLNELAERTLTDRSSVSGVVDRLEDAGLVSRRSAEHDRRRAEIRITGDGRAVLNRAPPPPTQLLLDALRRLPRSSVERLGRTLAQLNVELGFHETDMLFEDR
ncbi:MAG: MarR family transcriptional regulator [Gemmatimonadaceae bacterium]